MAQIVQLFVNGTAVFSDMTDNVDKLVVKVDGKLWYQGTNSTEERELLIRAAVVEAHRWMHTYSVIVPDVSSALTVLANGWSLTEEELERIRSELTEGNESGTPSE